MQPNNDSPFNTTLDLYKPTEPSQEEVLDIFVGTLGNIDLSAELLQKRYPTYNRLKLIRSLGQNQAALNEAIRTFSLIEAAALKTKMAVLLGDSILDLSPADLMKNYIALTSSIMTTTTPNPNQPGITNNTQINIAQTIRDSLPPHVQEALRILTEPNE